MIVNPVPSANRSNHGGVALPRAELMKRGASDYRKADSTLLCACS